MNIEFIESCDDELEGNSYKGNLEDWYPDRKELTKEINWHMAKLNHALLSGDVDMIKELSCDVANFCEKAYTNADMLEQSNLIDGLRATPDIYNSCY